jgi:undecaprenyl-diphosphatase
MDWILALDQSLFVLINTGLTNSIFDVFFPFITDLHKNHYFAGIALALLFFILVKKFSKKGIYIFLFCLLNQATIDLAGNHLFKKNFERMRPGDNPTIQSIVRSPYGGFSFVSNHAAGMFGFAVFVGFFLTRSRVFLFTIAGLVAFSRVYNGVHFPSDVVIGALLGVLIALGYIKLFERVFEKNKATVA